MALDRKQTIGIGAAILGLVVGGVVYVQSGHGMTLDGTWDCQTHWTCDLDGAAVPCAYTEKVTCTDGVSSSAGVLSIGAAQWSEVAKGTYRVSDSAIDVRRSSITTTPKNEAARQFEREHLKGKRLGTVGVHEFRAHIVSFTETQLRTLSPEGRTTTCSRL